MDRGACWAIAHGVTSVGHYLVTKLPPWDLYIYKYIFRYISVELKAHVRKMNNV